MRCAVKNCNNNNKTQPCIISFFNFPADPKLLKQWKSICGRESKMNTKTSQICMEHFKPEDFENSLQFEMGFTKRRFLKRGAVPTVRKGSSAGEEDKARGQRIQKRENKKIVEMLIKEYDAESALLTEDATESSEQAEETEGLMECQLKESEEFLQRHRESLSSAFANNCEKNEIERIRQENADLKKALENQAAQLRDFEQEREMEAYIYENKIDALTTRLSMANYELNNLEQKLSCFFTKGQIAKLKSGMKRRQWTDEDITQAISLYAESSKIYKMLYRKNFPLPAVRTLQVWIQKAQSKKLIMRETEHENHLK